MPLHKCIYCNYSTEIKHSYNKHLKTKKHENIINNINNKDTNIITSTPDEMTDVIYNCKYCTQIFTRHNTLIRHENKYCKNKNETLKFKEMEDKYKKEIERLHKRIEKLLLTQGNTTTIINIDKQINFNSCGSNDISQISAGFVENLLKIPHGSTPMMIEDDNQYIKYKDSYNNSQNNNPNETVINCELVILNNRK